MNYSEERDVVGEVITEDVAGRKVEVYMASYIPYEGLSLNGSCAKHDGCEFVGKSEYDALRQQLADVSNERDGLRALLVRVIESGGIASDRFEELESDICSILKPTEPKVQP